MTWKRDRVQRAFTRLAIEGLCFAGAWWLLWFYLLEPRVELPSLDGVDRVRVDLRSSHRWITGPAEVAAVVAFAHERRDGWRGTWHTMPVSKAQACFYRGDELRYCVGAGPLFLGTWGPGVERPGLQSLSATEARRFASMVGVADTLLDRW